MYTLCKQIPKGKVTTYKAIAEKLNTKAYQSVGQALRKNPYKEVPCHRVLSSKGDLHGFKGEKSKECLKEKESLLQSEGVKVKNGKVDLSTYLYSF